MHVCYAQVHVMMDHISFFALILHVHAWLHSPCPFGFSLIWSFGRRVWMEYSGYSVIRVLPHTPGMAWISHQPTLTSLPNKGFLKDYVIRSMRRRQLAGLTFEQDDLANLGFFIFESG
jgi:hypothetical protein